LKARQFLLWLETCLVNVTVLKPSAFVLRLKPGKQKGKALQTQTRAPGPFNYQRTEVRRQVSLRLQQWVGQIADAGSIPGEWKSDGEHLGTSHRDCFALGNICSFRPHGRLLWIS